VSEPTPPDPQVLGALGLADAAVAAFDSGLINKSWLVLTRDRVPIVLQRVNPMFPPAIHEDIDQVTRHLAEKGLLTPRLIPTPEGKLWLEHDGVVWRLLTYVPGVTRESLDNRHQASEAGALLARFHRALSDLEHTFANARLGVHDTKKHIAALREALATHRDHPQYDAVEPLGEAILSVAGELPDLPSCPDRIVHGDPKISNIIFDEATHEALCLIDLDTLAPMPVMLELGDALRSWCNPRGEEEQSAALSLPLLRGALSGYAREAQGFLTEPEWRAITAATLTITTELAARFATDALLESYFAWDPRRYASASAHNQARAKSQLNLARSTRARLTELEAELETAFAPE
jgi:Ser/Thr protein kinase RdoA (MazF antagonist)